MCMFLYGGINEDIDIKDYEKIDRRLYDFKIGSRSGIKQNLNAHEYDYVITHSQCDCGTAIGLGNAKKQEVKELAEHIKGLQNVRGIKWLYISKKWWDDEIEDYQTVHINDIHLPYFLANLKEKCLYEIQMFPKYY